MSQFVEFLPAPEADSAEPISLAEAKMQARIDPDLTDEDSLIEQVIIPGARQLAEERTGAVIRPARYIQRRQGFPNSGGALAITHSLIRQIESITYAGDGGNRITLSPMDYESIVIDRETLIAPISGNWPAAGKSLRAVEITYTAGVFAAELAAKYPGVKHWLLLAVAWGVEQKELFVIARGRQAFQEMPTDYTAGLLNPIMLPPRF